MGRMPFLEPHFFDHGGDRVDHDLGRVLMDIMAGVGSDDVTHLGKLHGPALVEFEEDFRGRGVASGGADDGGRHRRQVGADVVHLRDDRIPCRELTFSSGRVTRLLPPSEVFEPGIRVSIP